jgi:hypothetical protein
MEISLIRLGKRGFMSDSNSEVNRRQFAKRAVVTTAAGSLSLLGTSLILQNDSSVPAAFGEEHQPAIAEPIPPESIPVDLLLLEVVRQLHPDRKLTHQHLREIRRDIAHELHRAKAIRSVPLRNANEPAAMFAAYRGEDSGD